MDRGENIQDFARQIRLDILKMCKETGTGHVGSAFSVVEILAVLYDGFLRGRQGEKNRDRLVFSKGHACTALYSILLKKGILPEERFRSFAINDTKLGHHPHFEPQIGLEVNAGSLGHGLSISAGIAHACRIQGNSARVFVVQSDGETQEGSVWEAASFIAHHKLNNVCMVLDANQIQALGKTSEINQPTPHVVRWEAFGWDTVEVDGHDVGALRSAFAKVGQGNKPLAVIAHTIKGKGVGFMEGNLLWHYRKPEGKEYENALKELG